jgi:hypothetical protein
MCYARIRFVGGPLHNRLLAVNHECGRIEAMRGEEMFAYERRALWVEISGTPVYFAEFHFTELPPVVSLASGANGYFQAPMKCDTD